MIGQDLRPVEAVHMFLCRDTKMTKSKSAGGLVAVYDSFRCVTRACAGPRQSTKYGYSRYSLDLTQ